MIKFELKGVESLQRDMKEAQRITQQLKREIEKIHFDVSSVESSIANAKGKIDAMVRRHSRNQFVKATADALKQEVEAGFRDRAKRAKKKI